MGKEFRSLIDEIFEKIAIDGITQSMIPKINYLFENILPEDYTNKLIATIFLLEQNNTNTLLKLHINKIKNDYVLNIIENPDKQKATWDDYCEGFEEECQDDELHKLFEKKENGEFFVKDGTVSNLPKEGQFLKIRTGDSNFEYMIDHVGKLISSEKIDDDSINLDEIDYDEIYNSSLPDLLRYNDDEQEENDIAISVDDLLEGDS